MGVKPLDFSREYKQPEQNCPCCGKRLDRSTGGAEMPSTGDISVCIGCREPLVVIEGGMLRRPTVKERAELLEDPRIQTIRAAMLTVRAKFN